jgi:hypothetical protein
MPPEVVHRQGNAHRAEPTNEESRNEKRHRSVHARSAAVVDIAAATPDAGGALTA